MKIPKHFKLMGQTIQVVFSPSDFIEKDGYYGFSAYRQNQIQLRPSVPTLPLTDEQIGQTFCHELMHFIIYNEGFNYKGIEDYMHQEEAFIDLCGHLLHQALTTMEYESVSNAELSGPQSGSA